MISGLTLLQADESERDRWSYLSLTEEIRRLVANPSKDAPELFRRMCFNALISNIDDHPRNHALIAKERQWNLSPSYDLMPSPVVAQERRDLAMTCGDKGRFACASNILSQHTRFLFGPVDAQTIVERMRQRVSATWYDVVRAEGVSEKDAEAIGGRFRLRGLQRLSGGRWGAGCRRNGIEFEAHRRCFMPAGSSVPTNFVFTSSKIPIDASLTMESEFVRCSVRYCRKITVGSGTPRPFRRSAKAVVVQGTEAAPWPLRGRSHLPDTRGKSATLSLWLRTRSSCEWRLRTTYGERFIQSSRRLTHTKHWTCFAIPSM
jgi:HipA-like C-terminal domain